MEVSGQLHVLVTLPHGNAEWLILGLFIEEFSSAWAICMLRSLWMANKKWNKVDGQRSLFQDTIQHMWRGTKKTHEHPQSGDPLNMITQLWRSVHMEISFMLQRYFWGKDYRHIGHENGSTLQLAFLRIESQHPVSGCSLYRQVRCHWVT
jgi:hypothetical protein